LLATTASVEAEVFVKVTGFIWLEDIVEKLAEKHSVQQQEVEDI
jgi:hypothetical protein